MSKPTTLNCSRRSALTFFAAIAALFLFLGCASLFRSAGLTHDQADQLSLQLRDELAAAAATAMTDIQTSITEGQDLKTAAIRTGSAFIWKLATIAASTIGTVLSALLAKRLGTEKNINASMIGAIEHAGPDSVKKAIKNHATAAGIEPQLHARVKALT